MSDDGTAFSDKERPDGSRKRDILFNAGAEDGSQHGHVVESEDDEGDRTYHHARDVAGAVYQDDSRPAPSGDVGERIAALAESQRQRNRGSGGRGGRGGRRSGR